MAELNQKDANNRSELAYKLYILKNVNFGRFKEVIDELHRRTGKSKAWLAADVVRCMKKYDAGYNDYQIFQWYNLKDWQKDTFFTRFRNKKFIMMMNDQSYSDCFNDKIKFNNIFKDFLGRDFIDVKNASKEEIAEFFKGKEKIFCKMLDLSCGKGAELLYAKDFANADAFYDYIVKKDFDLLEGVIENHPDLAEMYPCSANCMRMITLIDDNGEPHLIYCVQKFGNEGRVVDNFGLHGPVDLETGEFLFPAHPGDTTSDILYTQHPYTGKKLIGFKTPMFKEAKEMILKAAQVIPQLRYVGWDVAITPDGPVIIEGNDYCAHDFWQLPGQTPDGIGAMPMLERLIPDYKVRNNAGKQGHLLDMVNNRAYFKGQKKR